DSISIHPKLTPKDVPGTLLNLALLNLGSSDPQLRSAAYNLLCALVQSFQLKIDGHLLETSSLCIPANNTLVIVAISSRLASSENHLTLEFLEECIQGFSKEAIEMKHLCLEYMTPWLPNLEKFVKHADDSKRHKVCAILDKLIIASINEVEMYPSIQAKIWGTIGKVKELIDVVLDSFIKVSIAGEAEKVNAEIMADTAVALASSNVKLVSKKIISRLCKTIEKTCESPVFPLESHVLWEEMAVLQRYLLMLSFNNSLDVANHLPYIFHVVTMLVSTGPKYLRASTHGLLINTIHSLCTCNQLVFSEETMRFLRLFLAELSLDKFYRLFYIEDVKSSAVTAFQCNEKINGVGEKLKLQDLECLVDSLVEVMEACLAEMPGSLWLQQWAELVQ
ncbi:neurofibromin-like, partial [Convolutriloba macropyga]|uniref:neurofibromin-like n=1 Tax=Convolutriloba macropyga TaxID=536237 RepID=UPI003F51B6C0